MSDNQMRIKVGYSGKVVFTLVLVILVLVAVVAYIFLIAPSINGYIVNKQIEAQQILVSTIIQQIQAQGYVQIPVSSNESLVLVPYQSGQGSGSP
ncbi:MAG: hypothetical protein Q7S56_02805 [Nanoarchaeota archaeon]|nr:hypothetical protein [Nanoarchaeota archaeon]